MRAYLENLYDQSPLEYTSKDKEMFMAFRQELESGNIRAAEPTNKGWQVNTWVKKGIMLGFRMGEITAMPITDNLSYTDKDTYGFQNFLPPQKIRLVPGGSSVRQGAYISNNVTMMPPMYVNVGAYVDAGTMIDSHALVGSCAQIGKNVHLSAGAMIGGVIEPIGASPVIIEDNAFIGGNTGVYEGVIVSTRAVIAPGTVITAATPVYDAVNQKYLPWENKTIPPNAVVVPGTRPLKSNPDFSVYCPIIIKYRDAQSEASLQLVDYLRT